MQKLTYSNSSNFPNNKRCNVGENQKSNLHAPTTLRLKEQSAATRAVHPPGVDKNDDKNYDDDDKDNEDDGDDVGDHSSDKQWALDLGDNCRW